jgi:phospholipid transport system substrate-binding protein
MLSRRTLFQAALAGLLMISAALPARAQEADAKVFVEKLANTAITTMTNKGLSDGDRAQRFRQLFVSSFDIPEISRFVMGRYWRTATPEQQQQFLKEFEEIQVLTWANRFKDYEGISHQVTNVAADGERGVIVDSRLQRANQDPLAIQWRLRQAEGTYKVLDLVVAGTSMAITLRSEYASVIQGNGGVDGLLALMRKKIGQMQTELAAKP